MSGVHVNKNCTVIYNACPSHLQSLAEDLQLAGCEGGTDGKDLPVCTCMCGSAHDCGCMVDDSSAMTAS